MKIHSLIIQGFKVHKDQIAHNFSMANEIQGDNFQGKTTVGEAICWGLYGVDLFGSNQGFDRLLNNKSKEAVVEVSYEYEGETHTLIRSRKGNNTTLILDDREAKQSDVELPDMKIFLATFNIHYFQKLSNKDARDLLMSVLPAIKPDNILANMAEHHRKPLEGYRLFKTDELAKDFRQEIKETEDEITRTKGQLDVLREQLNAEIPVSRDFDEERLNQLEQKILELRNSTTPPKLMDTTELEKELNSTGAQYKLLVQQKKNLEQSDNFEPGSKCETCGQEISEEHVHSVESSKQMKIKELAAQMEDLMLEGMDLKNRLDHFRVGNERLREEYKETVLQEIQKLEAEARELRARKQEVANHNERRRSMIKLQKEAETKVAEKEKYIEELNNSKFQIQQRIDALKQYDQTYTEMQNEVVKPYLNRVSIRLAKLVKSTGEVKPDFELLFDGKEQRVLSTSEEILVGLEISNMFNQITGKRIPVFVDYREAINDKYFAEPDVQYFAARFVPDAEFQIKSIQKEVA